MDPTEYELIVKAICEELSQEEPVQVHHQREYTGRVSRRKIKVDVSFETQVLGARVLVLVECKCYSRPVPVGDVEEFYGKLNDIGAHKGIMVTRVGYQDGAVKTARGRGIALALLGEDQSHAELSYVCKEHEPVPTRSPARPILQGNLRPWGRLSGPRFERGFGFGSPGALIQLLRISMSDQVGLDAEGGGESQGKEGGGPLPPPAPDEER